MHLTVDRFGSEKVEKQLVSTQNANVKSPHLDSLKEHSKKACLVQPCKTYLGNKTRKTIVIHLFLQQCYNSMSCSNAPSNLLFLHLTNRCSCLMLCSFYILLMGPDKVYISLQYWLNTLV